MRSLSVFRPLVDILSIWCELRLIRHNFVKVAGNWAEWRSTRLKAENAGRFYLSVSRTQHGIHRHWWSQSSDVERLSWRWSELRQTDGDAVPPSWTSPAAASPPSHHPASRCHDDRHQHLYIHTATGSFTARFINQGHIGYMKCNL